MQLCNCLNANAYLLIRMSTFTIPYFFQFVLSSLLTQCTCTALTFVSIYADCDVMSSYARFVYWMTAWIWTATAVTVNTSSCTFLHKVCGCLSWAETRVHPKTRQTVNDWLRLRAAHLRRRGLGSSRTVPAQRLRAGVCLWGKQREPRFTSESRD